MAQLKQQLFYEQLEHLELYYLLYFHSQQLIKYQSRSVLSAFYSCPLLCISKHFLWKVLPQTPLQKIVHLGLQHLKQSLWNSSVAFSSYYVCLSSFSQGDGDCYFSQDTSEISSYSRPSSPQFYSFLCFLNLELYLFYGVGSFFSSWAAFARRMSSSLILNLREGLMIYIDSKSAISLKCLEKCLSLVIAYKNLSRLRSSYALKPVPSVFCFTKSSTIRYVSSISSSCFYKRPQFFNSFLFFTSLSTGVSIPLSACSQKSGASILISLVQSDLNLVFEKVHELLLTAYSTFLAFLERMSQMDWLKNYYQFTLLQRKPTMPFLRRVYISVLVSCFQAQSNSPIDLNVSPVKIALSNPSFLEDIWNIQDQYELAVISLYTVTSFFWPILCARAVACISF